MPATSEAVRKTLADRHARWFELLELGISKREIARRYRVSIRTVQHGVAQYRDQLAHQVALARGDDLVRDPPVTPLYGCKAFTPLTTCDDIHHGPIPRGARVYCEVCRQTGCEGHPLLQRMPGDEKPVRSVQTPDDGLAGGTGPKPRKETSRCVC